MSSRKRKSSFPQKLSTEQQQFLTWNTSDLHRNTQTALIDKINLDYLFCHNHELTGEIPEKNCTVSKKKRKTKTPDKVKEFKISTNLPNTWHCVIGTFKIVLTTNGQVNQSCLNSDVAGHGNVIKVTVDLDNILNNEMNDSFISFGSNSDTDGLLPQSLRCLSMEGKAILPENLMDAILVLQDKGILNLVTKEATSIFSSNWDVRICLNQLALTTMKFASEDKTLRKTDKMIKILIEYFFDVGISSSENDDSVNDDESSLAGFDDLYKSVMCRKDTQVANCSCLIPLNKFDINGLTLLDHKEPNNGITSPLHAYNKPNKCITLPLNNYNEPSNHTTLPHYPAKDCQGVDSQSKGSENDILNNEKNLKFQKNSLQCKLCAQLQHPNLKPVLRRYQRRAVQWMRAREKNTYSNANGNSLHPLWKRFITNDKKVLFYNPYIARLTTEQFPQPPQPPGGILADEMGLGKTVEVLACILNSPMPDSLQYDCSKDQLSQPKHPITSQTVSPSTLLSVTLPQPVATSKPVEISQNMATSLSISKCYTTSKPISTSMSLSHSVLLGKPSALTTKSTQPESTSRSNSQSLDTSQPLSTSQPIMLKSLPMTTLLSRSTCPTTPQPLLTSTSRSDSLTVSSSQPRVMTTVSTPIVSTSCSLLGLQPLSMSQPATTSQSVAISQPITTLVPMPASPSLACSTQFTFSTSLPAMSVVQTVPGKVQDHTPVNLAQPHPETIQTNKDIINKPKVKTIRCECICGSTQARDDEELLKCTKCFSVLHSSCLQGSFKTDKIFLCPKCAVKRPAIPSKATLIISPEAIAHQWVEEITRHTSPGTLQILVYEGVNKQGFISPEVLADHDIILTTYTTLRADFHHLATKQSRSLRYQKRYLALPSPLTAIKFWRICLDEAQMVETTTAKAAEMALQLQCVHRWCVTGTPIQKGLEDLYGLLLFLGVFPYCQRVWWKKLLYEPYLQDHKEPMYNVLSTILWRTAKNDVLHEIQLPHQMEHLVRLTFTPVEAHFYQRQHEECSAWALKTLGQFGHMNIRLNALDRNTVHRILIPLLRLRQACCHPQAVRGGFLSLQKSTMTMDQLLETLIARAKLECEEAHRQLLFAINGLAGVHAIKEEWPTAVDLYRDAMNSWMEHEKNFRTDALQKLHTLHNICDILFSGHPGCSRTLRDDKFKQEAEDLRKQYMLRPDSQVQTAVENLLEAIKYTEELKTKVDDASPWWLIALDCVHSKGLDLEFISRVRDELSSMESSILDSFTDLSGLQYVITTKLGLIESSRENLTMALDKLRVDPTPTMVHLTASCCLRSKPKKEKQLNRCQFCEVDDIFTEYESRLFGHQGMKGIQEQSEAASADWHRHGNTGGLRAETETEKVLKVLLSFVKYQRLVLDQQQHARDHLALVEAWKREFKSLRGAWFALRERVSSLDELEMCTTRLRTAFPGENVDDDDRHIIPQGQVDQQRIKFASDRIVAKTDLRKRLGQYLYLTNLSKSQKFNGGENPDPCPVCTKPLGKEWSVYSCGHCYCCQCVWILLRQAGIGPRNRDVHIKCPVCRTPTLAREISYVCTAKERNSEDKAISVKGSHSTKVEAIVRTLLTIISDDSTAKCLVFSTWQDVLELIGKALFENGINFRNITCARRLQVDLQAFKSDSAIPVLLLPLQTGSNGLNIVEATHVLLVEPALNPAHELQAIGRVHRIGQTRPTHVHRFIIEHSVESRMYSLLKATQSEPVRTGSKDTENSALTIADLRSLFDNDESSSDYFTIEEPPI